MATWTCGRAASRRRGAPAGSTAGRGADRRLVELLTSLDYCGYLCAATGRYAEAVTVWAAYAALFRDKGYTDPPAAERRSAEPLREARQALGPDRAARPRTAARR